MRRSKSENWNVWVSVTVCVCQQFAQQQQRSVCGCVCVSRRQLLRLSLIKQVALNPQSVFGSSVRKCERAWGSESGGALFFPQDSRHVVALNTTLAFLSANTTICVWRDCIAICVCGETVSQYTIVTTFQWDTFFKELYTLKWMAFIYLKAHDNSCSLFER